MIKKIVDADSQAQAMVEADEKAAEEEKRKIEEEAAAIYKRYMDKAMEEVEINDAYLEKRSERKIKEISAKQESALIKLRADYEQNRDKWVDEIVSRVVS